MRFETFVTWAEVVAWADAHSGIWYHAPLDYQPHWVRLECVNKRGHLRLNPMSSSADPFWADVTHLNRMCRPVDGPDERD
jgi:hypothetical protein